MSLIGSNTNVGNISTVNFVVAFWLYLTFGCIFITCPAGPVTEVYTGPEFVESLQDPTQIRIKLMDDIVLKSEDFPGSNVINILRNLTIEAGTLKAAAGSSDAIIDFNHVKQKVRLGANMTLTLRHIILVRFREGSITASPGFDVLLPTQVPSGSQPAIVRIEDCLVVIPWCYPPTLQAQNIKLFVRPSTLPGVQNVTLRMSQSGCTNDTLIPSRQRCWGSIGIYNDFGLVGQDMGRFVFAPNNYSLWLVNTMYACNDILAEDCIATFGPVGCLYHVTAPSDQAMPPSPALPPARAGAAPVIAGSVAGGVGFLALVLATIAVLIWWRQRRRRRARAGGDLFTMGLESGATREDGSAGGQAMRKAHADSPGGPGPEFDLEATDEDTNSRMAGTGQEDDETGALLLDVGTGKRSRTGTGPDLPSLDLHMVVTPLTPPRPDLALGVVCGNEVTLLPAVRGKGSFGRVQEGIYGGQRVAVKLLPCDILTEAEPTADDAADGHGSCGSGLQRAIANGEAKGKEEVEEEPKEKSRVKARAGDVRALETFAQEVEVLGRCQHPNVVRLLAACLGPPQPCLVMELMETSLDQLVHARNAPLLPMPMVMRIAINVVRGLEYLHPTIVHRDLKPANVLVNISGAEPIAKISDFGLSRMRSTVIPTQHPEAGTPAYMAPECFDTENMTITHQADIFSFAVVVWEMLTGLLPWWGCTPVAVAYAVTLLGERLPLSTIPQERCPQSLSRLLTQCFDAEPRRRPAAAELVKELALIAEASGTPTRAIRLIMAGPRFDSSGVERMDHTHLRAVCRRVAGKRNEARGSSAAVLQPVASTSYQSAAALANDSYFTNLDDIALSPRSLGPRLVSTSLPAATGIAK